MTDNAQDGEPDTDENESEDEHTASSHGASGGPIYPVASNTGDHALRIPPDASEEQAAAIAAAIAAYLDERDRPNEEPEEWDGDRWAFAGRLDGIRRPGTRVPSNAPRDAWTASGRSDRF